MPRPAPRRRRNSLRLPAHDYGASGAYLVTICTAERRCLFGEVVSDVMVLSPTGETVAACWRGIPRHCRGIALDVYVVMPNHVHGIVWLSGARHASPLRAVVGSFKAAASRKLGARVWQRSFHDRVIRNEPELEALRRYVAENPLRWALDRENPGA